MPPMRRRLAFSYASLGLLSACGGGTAVTDTGLTIASLPSPVITAASPGLPLYQQLDLGPATVFPGNPTLTGDTINIQIDGDFEVSLINSEGVALQKFDQFGAGNPYNEELTTWYRDNGRDAFAWLVPFDPAANVPSVVDGLDYTTFGVWVLGAGQDTRGDVITPVEVTDAGIVLLGSVTPSLSLPPTGTATYSGSAVAFDADCLMVNDLLDGTVSLLADFGAKTIGANLTLRGENDTIWGTISSEPMAINASNQFAGNANSSNGHQGSMAGFFTGPSGQEIGGNFDLIREDPDHENRIIGAFGAVLDDPT